MIAILLCSFAPLAAAATDKPARTARDAVREVRAAVEAGTRKADAAYRRGEPWFDCPDSTTPRLKTFTGEIKTCGELRAAVAAKMGRIHDPRIRVHVDSMTVRGDTSIVFSTQHFSRKVKDSTGSWHRMATSARHRETWVRGTAGWTCEFIEEISATVASLDGMPYSGPGGK